VICHFHCACAEMVGYFIDRDTILMILTILSLCMHRIGGISTSDMKSAICFFLIDIDFMKKIEIDDIVDDTLPYFHCVSQYLRKCLFMTFW